MGFKKKFGVDIVYAVIEAAVDYGWSFEAGVSGAPKIDMHFFAGGQAYVSVFGQRIQLIEAYAKAIGNLDVEECQARFNGEDPDPDKNVVKFGVLASIMGAKHSMGFKKELCGTGDPCQPQVSDDPLLLYEGSMTLFTIQIFMMIGPFPVVFMIKGTMQIALYYDILGVVGKPEVLAYEKEFMNPSPSPSPSPNPNPNPKENCKMQI